MTFLIDTDGKRLLGGLQGEMTGYRPAGFTKYAGNPIFVTGTPGSWDDWGVRELAPVIDENGYVVVESDGIWAYYFGRPSAAGTIQVGLAKSVDGGYVWARYSGNPIISPSGIAGSWRQSHVGQASTVKRASDGLRMMMAAGITAAGMGSLGVFTSNDGLAWTDGGQKLTLGQFADGAVGLAEMGVPSCIKLSGGGYLCLLEGRLTGVTNGWRIFGATSSDFIGTWTPLNGGQPLLTPTGAGWEQIGVANAHIIEATAGQFLIAYNGISTDGHWRVGLASSDDPLTWNRYTANPVVDIGASAEWDELNVEACFLLKHHEPYWRLFYQGYAADGSMMIGLAQASQMGGGTSLQ
jgi:hypothetical protein